MQHEARRAEQRCASMQATVQKMMAKKDRKLQLTIDLEAQWMARQSEGVRKAAPTSEESDLEHATWQSVLAITRDLDDLMAELDIVCDIHGKHDLAAMSQMPFSLAKDAVEASFTERFEMVRDACRKLST